MPHSKTPVHLIHRNAVRSPRLDDQAISLWNKACCSPEWTDFPDVCGATFWRDLSDPADADQPEFNAQDNARVILLNGHDADINSGGTNFSIGLKGISKAYPNLSSLSSLSLKKTRKKHTC